MRILLTGSRLGSAARSSRHQSVYRVTELVGVSSESWEAAARSAIATASKTLRDLRIGEAHRFDVTIADGKFQIASLWCYDNTQGA